MSIGGRANLKHRKIPLSSLSTKDETSKGLEKEKLEENKFYIVKKSTRSTGDVGSLY